MSNLISNALRYGVGTVSVLAEDTGADARVSVHNDGPPIPAELLPLIFEPFERGTQDRRGLGLGLYIVQEIVKAHQGDVSATSSSADSGDQVLNRVASRPGPLARSRPTEEDPRHPNLGPTWKYALSARRIQRKPRGQLNGECGPILLRGVNLDSAAVCLRDALRNEQPEPETFPSGAAVRHAVKRFKEAVAESRPAESASPLWISSRSSVLPYHGRCTSTWPRP